MDGTQGYEADVVLVSFVRSNKGGHLGFVNNRRRINVAVSRALLGNLLIGNLKTCSQIHDVCMHLPLLTWRRRTQSAPHQSCPTGATPPSS